MRETERRYWEHVTPSCMTEESDSENGEKILTHQLLWRSECTCVCVRVRVCVCVCVRVCACVALSGVRVCVFHAARTEK